MNKTKKLDKLELEKKAALKRLVADIKKRKCNDGLKLDRFKWYIDELGIFGPKNGVYPRRLVEIYFSIKYECCVFMTCDEDGCPKCDRKFNKIFY